MRTVSHLMLKKIAPIQFFAGVRLITKSQALTHLSHKNEQNDRMLIVTSLTQPGGRERVARINKQSNAHRRKPYSTRGKGKGHKNEQTIECSSSQA